VNRRKVTVRGAVISEGIGGPARDRRLASMIER
jgi:hypothetical protein